LIAGSPFTSGDAFVRMQTNRAVPFPQWVISLPAVKEAMRECGYRLSFHVAGEDDCNVDSYDRQHRVPGSASLLFLRSAVLR
jgi:hypothetical protein